MPSRRSIYHRPLSFILLLFFSLIILPESLSIKFSLSAGFHYPAKKCIWNQVHSNTLVIVTANVGPGPFQRTDIEIVDSSPNRNVYLSKRDIKGETRLAITTHADGEVGVCLSSQLSAESQQYTATRVIDLDVDIGAEAVDYNAIANQESLSSLETEMRKIEGIINEISEEMEFLQRREERFTKTNTSTNKRVQNFAWFTIFCLTTLGAWQIFHLRSFFKRKYLID